MKENRFSALALAPAQLRNLASLGYSEMTPIQSLSLPHLLEGKDVIAQSKTGSGKTAAFGLSLLENHRVKDFEVQALVLCPTRELAEQVSTEIRQLARALPNVKLLTLCGGKPLRPQAESLSHGAHIVVGTPGRIAVHLRKNTLTLLKVNTFVLDEADRMFAMGFQEQIEAITEQLPHSYQTLLFSATFPAQIEKIAKRVMTEPVTVKIDNEHDSASITEHFHRLKSEDLREEATRLLLLHYQPQSSLIFCNTKKETKQLTKALANANFSVLSLHGDMEQKERDQTMVQFSNRSIPVLVATDVAARGLDVEEVSMVVNYQIPHDPETYTHRIGRTGRAGSKGVAHTLFTQAEQHKLANLGKATLAVLDEELPASAALYNKPNWATNRTLQIDGGKKQKVRAGDILGALTAGDGIKAEQVGKINLHDNWSFVAIDRGVANQALEKLNGGKIKGKTFRARFIGK